MSPFFITGLPRSRTAWLSNLLTYKDSFCYHEALTHCRKVDDLKSIFARHNERYVGTADSGIPLFWKQLTVLFPKAPIVVVRRDFGDVCKSVKASIQEDISGVVLLHQRLEELIDYRKCLEVDYNKLSDPETILKIWRHCLGDTPFDMARWEMLDAMNIQIIKEKIRPPYLELTESIDRGTT